MLTSDATWARDTHSHFLNLLNILFVSRHNNKTCHILTTFGCLSFTKTILAYSVIK